MLFLFFLLTNFSTTRPIFVNDKVVSASTFWSPPGSAAVSPGRSLLGMPLIGEDVGEGPWQRALKRRKRLVFWDDFELTMLKLLVKQFEANLRFVVINDVDLAESSWSVKLCCIQRTQLLWTSSSVYLKITPWLTVLFSATASSALTFLVVQVVQNLSVTGSFRGRWWRASHLILMLSWLKRSLFGNPFKEMFHTCSTQFPVKKTFQVGKDARNHVTDLPKASGFMSSYKSYNAIARTIYLMHLAVSSTRKALKSKAWDFHRDHSRQLNTYTYHYYGYHWAYQCFYI